MDILAAAEGGNITPRLLQYALASINDTLVLVSEAQVYNKP